MVDGGTPENGFVAWTHAEKAAPRNCYQGVLPNVLECVLKTAPFFLRVSRCLMHNDFTGKSAHLFLVDLNRFGQEFLSLVRGQMRRFLSLLPRVPLKTVST